ncbi:MAG: Lrp/AsnC family transcriptional regulator [Pseudoclavibacter sp.]|nr:Lrp/AsnC family transcriptional regulator [Pseudoclavibacter sp.]
MRTDSADRQGPGGLDELDRRIVAELQRDGRAPFTALGERLGVPASSVRYRVQRLQEQGVLQIVGIADPLTIGFDRLALIGISCEAGTAREVCARLAELPETSYVVLTTGSFDVIAEVVCRDIGHYTELVFDRLQHVPGVRSTETFFVLEAHKLAYGWGVG